MSKNLFIIVCIQVCRQKSFIKRKCALIFSVLKTQSLTSKKYGIWSFRLIKPEKALTYSLINIAKSRTQLKISKSLESDY